MADQGQSLEPTLPESDLILQQENPSDDANQGAPQIGVALTTNSTVPLQGPHLNPHSLHPQWQPRSSGHALQDVPGLEPPEHGDNWSHYAPKPPVPPRSPRRPTGPSLDTVERAPGTVRQSTILPPLPSNTATSTQEVEGGNRDSRLDYKSSKAKAPPIQVEEPRVEPDKQSKPSDRYSIHPPDSRSENKDVAHDKESWYSSTSTLGGRDSRLRPGSRESYLRRHNNLQQNLILEPEPACVSISHGIRSGRPPWLLKREIEFPLPDHRHDRTRRLYAMPFADEDAIIVLPGRLTHFCTDLKNTRTIESYRQWALGPLTLDLGIYAMVIEGVDVRPSRMQNSNTDEMDRLALENMEHTERAPISSIQDAASSWECRWDSGDSVPSDRRGPTSPRNEQLRHDEAESDSDNGQSTPIVSEQRSTSMDTGSDGRRPILQPLESILFDNDSRQPVWRNIDEVLEKSQTSENKAEEGDWDHQASSKVLTSSNYRSHNCTNAQSHRNEGALGDRVETLATLNPMGDVYNEHAERPSVVLPEGSISTPSETNGSSKSSTTGTPKTTTNITASQIMVTDRTTGELVSADTLNEEAIAWKTSRQSAAAPVHSDKSKVSSTSAASIDALPIRTKEDSHLTSTPSSTVVVSHEDQTCTTLADDTNFAESKVSNGKETQKEFSHLVISEDAHPADLPNQLEKHTTAQEQDTPHDATVSLGPTETVQSHFSSSSGGSTRSVQPNLPTSGNEASRRARQVWDSFARFSGQCKQSLHRRSG
ncbi:Nn.00g095210.m01.CDS01 [Neocucurbitaria sp. VM-36]